MSGKKTDWKSKYYELRSRHINAMDVSFRLGFQEGLKAAELQNMQMQLQQTQQAAAAGMESGGMPPEAIAGAPEKGGGMPPEAIAGAPEEGVMGSAEEGAPEEDETEEEPEGSELDSSISELEKLVSKNEKINFSKMLKSFHKSRSSKKNISELSEKHEVIDKIFKKWDS